MPESKHDIIARLQREILLAQGYRTAAVNQSIDLGPILTAFPNSCFPLGAMHEFIAPFKEDAAATSGFLSALLSLFMEKQGVAIWISAARTLFPPALTRFGICPEHIIFIDLKKEKEILWALEEALECGAVSAVIAELRELDFMTSRRLQLAVEESRVTGFIIRQNNRTLQSTACVSRWKINSLPSETIDELPGIGFPRWNIELLKVRNGKPGSWELEWANGKFIPIQKFIPVPHLQKQAG